MERLQHRRRKPIIAANLQEVRPTIMTAVPRLYEVLHDRIRRSVEQAGGSKAKLFARAIELGKKRHETPGAMAFGERVTNVVLDLLVRKKVSRRFGGRLKTFVSGGAALNPDIGNFFLSLGISILQGYGQTETSMLCCLEEADALRKAGTVGRPLEHLELRVIERASLSLPARDWRDVQATFRNSGVPGEIGEIVVRGPITMLGYWERPEETALTLREGWVLTGDLATIVYSSGTTGLAKGVRLTHRNILAAASALDGVLQVNEDDTTVLCLPLSHIYGRIAQYCALTHGFCIAYARRVDLLAEVLLEVRPSFFFGVPRLYERLYLEVVPLA